MTVKAGFTTHRETMIQHVMEDREFADYYLHEVLADGDAEEIQ